MSTNAVIRIEGFNVAELYKHWDGNSEATLQWLLDFNKDFEENRPEDESYKFAQLIRSSIRDAVKYNLDDSKHTGWGVSAVSRSSYDYLYILKSDGSVVIK